MHKKVMISLKQDELELIDKACKKTFRTRSNYVMTASLFQAEKDLRDKNENN